MGIGVKVACPCFGSFTLQIGPRLAPPQYCLFPFLCKKCRSVSNLDTYAALLSCSHCQSTEVVPFGEPPALGVAGRNQIYSCGATERFNRESLTLTDGSYFCPTCKQYTASFADAGILWD